jgi:hypothetical protein
MQDLSGLTTLATQPVNTSLTKFPKGLKMTTANKEADRIIADAEEAAQRYGAKDAADRLAYQVGVLQAHIRGLCHEAQYNSDEVKKLQQEILWERKQ